MIGILILCLSFFILISIISGFFVWVENAYDGVQHELECWENEIKQRIGD